MEGMIIGDSWAVSQALLHFAYDSGKLIPSLSLSLLSKGKVSSEAPARAAEEPMPALRWTAPCLLCPFPESSSEISPVLCTPDGMAVLFWLAFLGQGRLEQGITGTL